MEERKEGHKKRESELLFHLDLRSGSVVRTSVFGSRTFPDLLVIYG